LTAIPGKAVANDSRHHFPGVATVSSPAAFATSPIIRAVAVRRSQQETNFEARVFEKLFRNIGADLSCLTRHDFPPNVNFAFAITVSYAPAGS
jgi:hypothetical protein